LRRYFVLLSSLLLFLQNQNFRISLSSFEELEDNELQVSIYICFSHLRIDKPCSSRPVLLTSRETYELYEKRSVSPGRAVTGGYSYSPAPPPPARHASREYRPATQPYQYPPPKSHSPSVHFDDSINVEPQGRYTNGQQTTFVAGSPRNSNNMSFTDKINSMFPSLQQKRKLPMGWIICVAVSVPIFVMIVLFLAVWLQELGFL